MPSPTYMEWLLRNNAPTPDQGKPLLDLDQMPTPDSMAGQMPGSISSYEPGLAETAGPAVGAFAKDMVTAAPEAIYNAYEDPSLANLTKAGFNTALTLGKPLHAAGAVGLGAGTALLGDMGAFDMGAQAMEDPLLPAERTEYTKLSKKNNLDAAQTRRLQGYNDRIKEASKLAAEAKAKASVAGQTLEAEQAAKQKDMERRQYELETNRAMTRADQARARDRTFSDTTFGKFYDDMGGAVPLAMGFAGGALGRMMHGPAKGAKGYAVSGLEGAGGVFTGLNIPLVSDMARDVYNPKRREIEELAYGLPQNHPRKQEYLEYLKDEQALPKKNPVRENAREEFLYGMPGRVASSLAEGVPLGIAGMAIPAAAGRAYKGAQKWGVMPGGPKKRTPKVDPAKQPVTASDMAQILERLWQGKPALPPPAPAAPAKKVRGGKGKASAPAPAPTPTSYTEALKRKLEKLVGQGQPPKP